MLQAHSNPGTDAVCTPTSPSAHKSRPDAGARGSVCEPFIVCGCPIENIFAHRTGVPFDLLFGLTMAGPVPAFMPYAPVDGVLLSALPSKVERRLVGVIS